MHILYADDSEYTRRLFALWFRLAHHFVRLVENGAEAVTAVEEEAFDVILLDVQMPVMDGWEALQRIRQLPNGQSVPIALLSGVYDRIDLQPAMAMGADAIFAKPLYPDVVVADVQNLVARFREQQE